MERKMTFTEHLKSYSQILEYANYANINEGRLKAEFDNLEDIREVFKEMEFKNAKKYAIELETILSKIKGVRTGDVGKIHYNDAIAFVAIGEFSIAEKEFDEALPKLGYRKLGRIEAGPGFKIYWWNDKIKMGFIQNFSDIAVPTSLAKWWFDWV